LAAVLTGLLLCSGCAHRSEPAAPIDVVASQQALLDARPADPELRDLMAELGVDTRVWPLTSWDADTLTALAWARSPALLAARQTAQRRRAAALLVGQAGGSARSGRSATSAPSASASVSATSETSQTSGTAATSETPATTAASTSSHWALQGVDLSLEHHGDHSGNGSPWAVGIAIDALLVGSQRRQAAYDQAQAQADAAALQAEQQAWQIRHTVHQAWLSCVAAQARLAAADNAVDLARQGLLLTQTRLARGAADASEVARSQSDLQLEQAAELSAGNDLAQVRHDLAAAAGLAAEHLPHMAFFGPITAASADASSLTPNPTSTPSTPTSTSTPTPTPTPTPIAGAAPDLSTFAATTVMPQSRSTDLDLAPLNLQRQALHQRADLRLALAHYAALEAELQIEIARQYPELSIKPGYAWDRGDNRWSVGLGAALPLAWLQARPNQAAIDQALGARAAQGQQVREVQLGAITALDQARLSYTRASNKLAAAHERVTRAQHQLDRVERRIQAGAGDRADHLAARRQLLADAAEVDRAGAALARARLALEDALQSPLSPTALRWRPDHGHGGRPTNQPTASLPSTGAR
jgi:outer membrane protein TolC